MSTDPPSPATCRTSEDERYPNSGLVATNSVTVGSGVTLVKSGIGRNKKIRQTLKGLGLTKLHKTVTLKNTPAIRGMINKVSFMVKIEV